MVWGANGGQPTLIYDGSCGFCRESVQWFRERDPEESLEFLPYQSPDLQDRFPQVTREACERAMHLVLPDGRVLVGADALPAILRALPGYRIQASILSFPLFRPVTRAFYRLIANNRPRDRGAGSCSIHHSSR